MAWPAGPFRSVRARRAYCVVDGRVGSVTPECRTNEYGDRPSPSRGYVRNVKGERDSGVGRLPDASLHTSSVMRSAWATRPRDRHDVSLGLHLRLEYALARLRRYIRRASPLSGCAATTAAANWIPNRQIKTYRLSRFRSDSSRSGAWPTALPIWSPARSVAPACRACILSSRQRPSPAARARRLRDTCARRSTSSTPASRTPRRSGTTSPTASSGFICIYDHERASPNRAAGHIHFLLNARPGAKLTLEFLNLDNVWNGQPGSVAGELKTVAISDDGRAWRTVPTESLPGNRVQLHVEMRGPTLYVARIEPYRLSDLDRLLDVDPQPSAGADHDDRQDGRRSRPRDRQDRQSGGAVPRIRPRPRASVGIGQQLGRRRG